MTITRSSGKKLHLFVHPSAELISVWLPLDEKGFARSRFGAIVDHRDVGKAGAGMIGHGVPFLPAGSAGLFRGQRLGIDEETPRFRIELVHALPVH